jgi:hypothetical protein
MRTSLNLAANPFINHRLFWIAAVTFFFLSLWFALWVNAEVSRVRQEASTVESQIKAQEGRVQEYRDELERRRREKAAIIMTPEQGRELAAAHKLVASRAFSWNRLIANIERFVPKKAKVTSIQVEESAANDQRVVAQLEIKAIGQTAAQMTEMMESMDKSAGLFEVKSFTQEQAIESGETPFTLRVSYSLTRGEG